MLCSKLHCQKVSRLKVVAYKIGPCRELEGHSVAAREAQREADVAKERAVGRKQSRKRVE